MGHRLFKKLRANLSKLFNVFFRSITIKIVVLTALTALSTGLLIGGISYYYLSKIATEKEIQNLKNHTEQLVPYFRNAFQEMRNDVQILSKTPPIQGLIRSIENNGIDPVDGSTSEQWKERLGTIFQSLVEPKTHYIQVRYIGVHNDGLELVRVNQNEAGIEVVQEKDLQHKSKEPYFKAGIKLEPGEFFYSAINLNRENGKIQIPYTPVIRALMPIYNEKTGEIFGLLIINAAYDKFLQNLVGNLTTAEDLYMINTAGDYFISNREKFMTNFSLENTSPANQEQNAIIQAIQNNPKTEDTMKVERTEKTIILYYIRLFFDPNVSSRYLNIALTLPQNILLKDAYTAKKWILIAMAFLLFLSIGTAIGVSNYLTKPLRQMIREIKTYNQEKTDLLLPVHFKDEIGEMARSFEDLTKNLNESHQRDQDYMIALERSNEELDNFAYIASHDLQEPVRMVANFTDLLRKKYHHQFDEQAFQYMDIIVQGAARMQTLIDDLLEYSRLQTDTSSHQKIDCNTIIKNIRENLHEIIIETNAEITTSELPTLHTHPVRLSRVLQNLIGNAIKYRHPDRPPQIHIEVEEKPNEWLFSLQDNGIGMKDEYLKKIFIIFKRLHSKEDYQGNGIGLAVCKKIIENFGGEIWATSELGEGSYFYFTIPKYK